MAQPKIVQNIEQRVKKSGDIMTGDLTVKKEDKASIFMVNTDTNRVGFIETLSNKNINITNMLDSDNRTDFIITNEEAENKDGLFYYKKLNGNENLYRIYGEHNKEELLDSSYARLKNPNDFVFAGNEVTLVPGEFNDDLWFNHRTVGGYDGDIKSYRFGNGNGSLTDVYAKNFYGNLKGNADTCNGAALEWAGSISYNDTLWLGAWTNDGKKIKALDKKSFATASHTHSEYVKKRDKGAYTNLGDYYASGQTKPYVRIALPQDGSFWNMMILEITIRQLYSSGLFGKLYIYGHCYATSDWTCFNAVYDGLLNSNIKVYGSDKKYIYVAGLYAWGGLSVDRMLLGDAAYSTDLSNVVIDGVDALPTTYQTATMYKSWRQGDTLTSTSGTDYTTLRARNVGAGTSTAPSSLGNGEMWVKYS